MNHKFVARDNTSSNCSLVTTPSLITYYWPCLLVLFIGLEDHEP